MGSFGFGFSVGLAAGFVLAAMMDREQRWRLDITPTNDTLAPSSFVETETVETIEIAESVEVKKRA